MPHINGKHQNNMQKDADWHIASNTLQVTFSSTENLPLTPVREPI